MSVAAFFVADTVALRSVAPFDIVVSLMQCLAASAMTVVALEWRALQRAGAIEAVWDVRLLQHHWGWRRTLMHAGITRMMPAAQLLLALALVLQALRVVPVSWLGSGAAAGLAFSVWHTAVRVNGTINGGSDGMLFTVLLMLALAAAPLPTAMRHGAVLFAGAQVLLSYWRAGWVKAKERAWWTGDALAAFLDVPAYGVPSRIPRGSALLRVVSIGTIVFELAAPLALWSTSAALIYTAVAWCFHLATAVVFGLNRFVLAWSAGLPAVWFAAYLLHAPSH